MRYRSQSGILPRRLLVLARYALFATLVASLVGIYTAVVGPSLGKLRLESTSLLLIPMTVISGLVALPIHRALCLRQRTAEQVLTLYAGFFLVCLLYGVFGWIVASDGSPWFVPLSLIVGHILGFPLFLIILAAHLVLVRIEFYRVTSGCS